MKENKNVNKSEGKFATELFFWAQALVLSLVILVLFNVFFFRVSGVVGSSMEPTLQNGDRVFLRIIGYTEPQRGDIVVLQAPEFDDDPIVKRIIAVGGDEIKIDFFGNVYINGEVQYEPYILETISPNSLGDQVYPMTIPEGYVFFMGDGLEDFEYVYTDAKIEKVCGNCDFFSNVINRRIIKWLECIISQQVRLYYRKKC